MSFHNILVPTDGTPRSRSAARIAGRLAARGRGRVTALYIVPEGISNAFSGGAIYGGGVLGGDYDRRLERQARDALALVEREVTAAGAACVGLHAVARRPWRSIVDTARERGCDLIVMATGSREGWKGKLLGSETDKVVRNSALPVLVCR